MLCLPWWPRSVPARASLHVLDGVCWRARLVLPAQLHGAHWEPEAVPVPAAALAVQLHGEPTGAPQATEPAGASARATHSPDATGEPVRLLLVAPL